MARLPLTTQVTPGSYPTLPITANAADFVFTSAGANFADGFSFPWDGKTVLLVQNTNVGAQTITIDSVAEGKTKRTGSITTYSVGAAEFAMFGPFESDGWKQADGNVYGAVTATDVKLAAIRLNN